MYSVYMYTYIYIYIYIHLIFSRHDRALSQLAIAPVARAALVQGRWRSAQRSLT